MVFINLANLHMNRTQPNVDEAARLLRRAISLRADFVDAYQNYGSVLIKQGKYVAGRRRWQHLQGLLSTDPHAFV